MTYSYRHSNYWRVLDSTPAMCYNESNATGSPTYSSTSDTLSSVRVRLYRSTRGRVPSRTLLYS